MSDKSKSLWVIITPYIGAVILDVALCGLLVASGKELTVEAVVTITGCVGALLFFHKKGGSTIAGGALVVVATLLMSCGVPCQIEQTIVSALEDGIDAAESELDMMNEENHVAIGIARGVHEVGKAATDACLIMRDDRGWRHWVIWALEAVVDIAARFASADAPYHPQEVPKKLEQALLLLYTEYR